MKTDNEKNTGIEQGFCTGFAYGCKYGYEGVVPTVPMSGEEVCSTYIMAKLLFEKLKKCEDEN